MALKRIESKDDMASYNHKNVLSNRFEFDVLRYLFSAFNIRSNFSL